MSNAGKKDNQHPGKKRTKGKHTTSSASERFNTDKRQKASSRNVGPGYDDTGRGNDAKASRLDEKKSLQDDSE